MTESEEEKKKAEKQYEEEYKKNKKEKEKLYAKMYYWQNRYYNHIGLKKPENKEKKTIIINKDKLTYHKKGNFIIVFD